MTSVCGASTVEEVAKNYRRNFLSSPDFGGEEGDDIIFADQSLEEFVREYLATNLRAREIIPAPTVEEQIFQLQQIIPCYVVQYEQIDPVLARIASSYMSILVKTRERDYKYEAVPSHIISEDFYDITSPEKALEVITSADNIIKSKEYSGPAFLCLRGQYKIDEKWNPGDYLITNNLKSGTFDARVLIYYAGSLKDDFGTETWDPDQEKNIITILIDHKAKLAGTSYSFAYFPSEEQIIFPSGSIFRIASMEDRVTFTYLGASDIHYSSIAEIPAEMLHIPSHAAYSNFLQNPGLILQAIVNLNEGIFFDLNHVLHAIKNGNWGDIIEFAGYTLTIGEHCQRPLIYQPNSYILPAPPGMALVKMPSEDLYNVSFRIGNNVSFRIGNEIITYDIGDLVVFGNLFKILLSLRNKFSPTASQVDISYSSNISLGNERIHYDITYYQ